MRCQRHVDDYHHQQGNRENEKVGQSRGAGTEGVKIVRGFLGRKKTGDEHQSRCDDQAQSSLPLTQCTPLQASTKRIDQATVTTTVAVSQLPLAVQIR